MIARLRSPIQLAVFVLSLKELSNSTEVTGSAGVNKGFQHSKHCSIYLVPFVEILHWGVKFEVLSGIWEMILASFAHWMKLCKLILGAAWSIWGQFHAEIVRQYRKNSSRLSACTSYSSQVTIRLIICDLLSQISLINYQRRTFT